MNKFEHFEESDKIDSLYQHLDFNYYTINYDDVEVRLDITKNKKLLGKILNAALDAHIVQRVVNDPDKKPAESIEDKYTLKKLPDGKIWMMENLREKVEGAVWNEQYNCYMYTWEQAQKAVPKGFHLPSAREFMQLALAVGYLEKDDNEVARRLQDKCGFTMTGYVNLDGRLCRQDSEGNYWSSTGTTATDAYYLSFDGAAVYPEGTSLKGYGFSVRCVKD